MGCTVEQLKSIDWLRPLFSQRAVGINMAVDVFVCPVIDC